MRLGHGFKSADTNRYEVTTHVNGQSTVIIDGTNATGESYTIAHHVFTEGDARLIMVAPLRYFVGRLLALDRTECLHPQASGCPVASPPPCRGRRPKGM